jgi:hypothetical protein
MVLIGLVFPISKHPRTPGSVMAAGLQLNHQAQAQWSSLFLFV